MRACGPTLLQVSHQANADARLFGELLLREPDFLTPGTDQLACLATMLIHAITIPADGQNKCPGYVQAQQLLAYVGSDDVTPGAITV